VTSPPVAPEAGSWTGASQPAPGAVVVVGAGSGLGAAVARRFGQDGRPVGLIGRRTAPLQAIAADLAAEGVRAVAAPADIRDPPALRSALADLEQAVGPVEVLCFSPLPDTGLLRPVEVTTADDVRAALELNAVGAAAAVAAVLPGMLERGRGTLVFVTGGAAVRPSAERAVSAIAYAAESAYARMLHDAVAGAGVQVAQVTVLGAMGDGLQHSPDDVAAVIHDRAGEQFLTVVG